MRMYRKLLVTMTLCLVWMIPAKAWNGLRVNLDWGYMAAVHQMYNYNYLAEEGFRVDQKGSNMLLNSNGLIKMFIGSRIGNHTELGVFSGYEGIRQDRRIIPLGLRANWAFRGLNVDGPMCYIEGGAAFHNDCKTTGTGAAGIGWHLQLDHGCGLDLKLGVNLSGDHPQILGVPNENLLKSDYTYTGISLTIGISF